jgi:hypothetical protein
MFHVSLGMAVEYRAIQLPLVLYTHVPLFDTRVPSMYIHTPSSDCCRENEEVVFSGEEGGEGGGDMSCYVLIGIMFRRHYNNKYYGRLVHVCM